MEIASLTMSFVKRAVALYFLPLRKSRQVNRSKEARKNFVSDPNMRIRSLLGEGVTVKGDIAAQGHGFRIDCHLVGNVTSHDGLVVVSEAASIEGNVSANYIVVSGKIMGNLQATYAIELLPTAIVEGDVRTAVIEMHMGAAVRGKMEASESPNSDRFELFRDEVRRLSEDSPRVRLVK